METVELTMAFVGTEELHRNNALDLLSDLVEGFQKQHRRCGIRIVLPARSAGEWSTTLDDIEDWAETAGYDVDLVHPASMVTHLLSNRQNARLILAGNAEEDDTVYAVAEEADRNGIQIRSLIEGLKEVMFDDEDIDGMLDEEHGFHEVDLDDEDDIFDEEDDDDPAEAFLKAAAEAEEAEALGVAEAPDLDLLADLADNGEVDAQEEIKAIASTLNLDVTPAETWADAVALIRGNQVTEIDEDHEVFDGLQEEPDEELPDEDDEELDVLGPDLLEDDTTPDKKVTRAELEKMSFEDVKALGIEYGIAPGRGMKHGVYVNKILVLAGVETPADQVKRKPSKKKEATITPIRSMPTQEEEVKEIIERVTETMRGCVELLEKLTPLL